MGLRIIYGRAGSGKTAFCLKEIQNELDAGGTHPLIHIIPEQFSLQAEKNLARAAGSSGVLRAEVLSFRRLAFRVFSEVGGISRRHLNAAGKSMLLFKTMDRLGSELKIFSKAAMRKGFTDVLSDAITEFKRYDVPPEKLFQAMEKLEDGQPLKDKLHDLALVYSEFEKLLHEGYMDADDDLVELCKKLDCSTQFDGAEIWIDEFSGFTPQEYRVIGKLLKKAERVNICLCTDCLSDEPDCGAAMAFAPVRKTAVKLGRLAASEGIAVEKPAALGTADAATGSAAIGVGAALKTCLPRFAASEELGHLERNIYKYPYSKFYKYTGDVKLSSSANIHSEVEDAARDIIRLCRDEGYRYRDIAVVMRNPESYRSIVKSVFTRYGIPYFFDGKRNIDGHPLIVFILSALDIFTNSWSYEAVFRYAKTGLTGIEREDMDILENYVLANGIRGNAWTRENEWDYPVEPSSRKGGPSQQEAETLARINSARKQLTAPLQSFRSKTKGGTSAVVFCTALFELLCETGADKKIDGLSRKFAAEGLLDKSDEYRQVWNIVMDVFSQVVEVLGEEEMGSGRFSEILAAGFAGHKIGLIPPALDQVLAGSIERARCHDIKALYIIGANDGVFPGGKGDEGLLSDMDRDSLDELGLELAGKTENRCLEERFMVYMALATPSRYLWLSYPAADRDGKALRPSRLISEIKRILPLEIVRSTIANSEENGLPQPAAPEPAFDELAAQLRRRYDGESIHDGWKAIYKWFSGNEKWKGKCISIINGLGYTNQAHRLTGNRAAKLYGKPVFTSVSRMESFASCPFTYFVKYGLKAGERRMFRFDPVDAGTFMHQLIDEFSRMLVKDGISWRGLDRQWCAGQVSKLVEGHLSAKGGGVLGSSRRYLYLSDRLKRTVLKAIMLIGKHIERSSFEPSGYEVEFGDAGRYPPITIELPSGECIKMTGRIDRIDTMKNENGTYLRIIDYKSGNKALKLADVYYGLQLQLVTYLDAVLAMDEQDGLADSDNGQRDKGNRLPAGILYFRLDDPLIRCDRESTGEEIEKAIMRELRMKGLVLADVKLVREMDRQIDGDSLIIPARINKDGSLGRSSAATKDQFNVLCGYVRKTLASIGSEILNGNVAISPYKKRTMTACTYCSFSSVCQFDTSLRDNRYRIVPDLKEDELWQIMREAAGTKVET